MTRTPTAVDMRDVRILPHATVYIGGVALRAGQTVTLPAQEAAALVAQGLAEQTR